MKLYHGTGARYLQSIRQRGLLTLESSRRKPNWKNIPSPKDAVYLTTAYAVFYANACAKGNEDLIVLEIETDHLNPFAFAPDEDFMEQIHRGRDGISGKIRDRTKIYQRKLKSYQGELDDWAGKSLLMLGNCAYFQDIPPHAIERFARINIHKAKDFVYKVFDPSIVLMNYAVCGPGYRNSLKWLFGYPMEEDRLPHFIPPSHRDGITIEPLQGTKS